MDLTDQDIQEYKAIHRTTFGEAISEAEAREIASRLLLMYELLVQFLCNKPSNQT